jgi:hypothetical protein
MKYFRDDNTLSAEDGLILKSKFLGTSAEGREIKARSQRPTFSSLRTRFSTPA